MLDGPRYELPRGAQFVMTLWTVVWLFLSIGVAGNSSGMDIGGAVLLWVVGSLIGSAFIVWAMGGMQEAVAATYSARPASPMTGARPSGRAERPGCVIPSRRSSDSQGFRTRAGCDLW